MQHARESLTTGNVLRGSCMICLEELTSGGKHVFTSTACYHFFHWACIHSYVEHCRQEFEALQHERKSNVGSVAVDDEVFEVCTCTVAKIAA